MSVNNFSQIQDSGILLTVERFNQLYETDITFLKNEIVKSTENKRIVVTHHVPTLLNYPEQYKGSKINEAFAVELHDFILNSNVDYWIFGHHHSNLPPFRIGKTVMLTNQLGYIHHNEQKGFSNTLIFEI